MKTVCIEKHLSRNYGVEVAVFCDSSVTWHEVLASFFVVVVIAQVTPLGDKIDKVATKAC